MKSSKRIAKTTVALAGMMVGLMFAGGCVSPHKRAVMETQEGSYGAIAFSPDSRQLSPRKDSTDSFAQLQP
jgi:hypothetical protein